MSNIIEGFYSFFDDNKNEENRESGPLFSIFLNDLKLKQDLYGKTYYELIYKNIKNIFLCLKNIKNNILVIGEVQSGKTNNIIGITMNALDNDYDCVIIFGGSTNLLLKQTLKRIKDTLNNNLCDILLYDINKNKSSLFSLKKDKTKIIINVIKNKTQMQKISAELNTISKNFKVLIIDDECDYGSLNNGSSKNSAIYNEIVKIKNANNTKYIGITATPYANLTNSKSNEIYPEAIVKLIIEKNYTGIDFFNNKKYFEISQLNKKDDNFSLDLLLKKFLIFYILLSSFVKKYTKLNVSSIINVDIDAKKHFILKDKLFDIHAVFLRDLKNNNVIDYFEEVKKNLNKIAYFDNYDIEKYHNSIEVKVLNNKTKNEEINNNQNCIYIGGNLVSRGLTFENLICELMLNIREHKQPIDILLQRARWFGYRNKKININEELEIYFSDLMKIFISQNIKECFSEAKKINNFLYNELLIDIITYDVKKIKEKLVDIKTELKFVKYSDKDK
ncbi:Z1 domain-containing protein [Spiroplasma cantharicola]|uniref:Endonuclease Z1 domain-containing protein n=1 Tax=Spiroplasma cantharicola TaxID=362837 RepID=A0A0M4K1Q5_9MOLU|nr:Z1 domain-containing protein [Spiroplasma cantharicola]ALD66575.1 hypothetical protein SCANT_v1c06690 [Spiroplasma cantharicola]